MLKEASEKIYRRILLHRALQKRANVFTDLFRDYEKESDEYRASLGLPSFRSPEYRDTSRLQQKLQAERENSQWGPPVRNYTYNKPKARPQQPGPEQPDKHLVDLSKQVANSYRDGLLTPAVAPRAMHNGQVVAQKTNYGQQQ